MQLFEALCREPDVAGSMYDEVTEIFQFIQATLRH
jgi:hypothetical protein